MMKTANNSKLKSHTNTITTKDEKAITPANTAMQTKDGGFEGKTITQSKTIEVTTETTETYDNDKVTSKTVKETRNGKTKTIKKEVLHEFILKLTSNQAKIK